MSKPTAARYRTTNWSRYNASLKKRGPLLICLDKEMTLLAPLDGSRGRPAVFSEAAIHLVRRATLIGWTASVPTVARIEDKAHDQGSNKGRFHHI